MMSTQHVAKPATAPQYVVLTTWDDVKALQVETTALLQEHRVALARNKYKALYGALDASKPDSWYVSQMEEPGAETVKKYMGSGRKQVLAAIAAGISPWQVIERDAGSKNSWNTRRAALQFYLVERIRELKRRIDKVDSGTVTPSGMNEVKKELPFLANALQTIPTVAPSKFLAGSGFKPVGMSKARSLRKAPAGWELKVASRLSKQYWAVSADPILTHPADSILTRGWMPTA